MLIEYDTEKEFNKDKETLLENSLVYIHELDKTLSKIDGEWLEFIEEEVSHAQN